MHLTIVAIGSRGDIQPYIALGQGLQRAGHRVRLNTHLDFEALVRAHDLEFAPLHGNVRDLMSSEAGVSFAETGANPLKFVREFRGIARALIVEMLGDWRVDQLRLLLCGRADVLAGDARRNERCAA